MKRLVLFLFSLFVLFFASGNIALADSPNLKVEVNHIANVFEKLGEKVTLFFKFSKEGKAHYQEYLLEKRLAELKWVVDSKEWDPVEETSSRYATYLGNFSEFVIKNNLKDKKDEVLSTYERHEKVLEELQRNFEYDGGWWLLLQHDRNSTKIFSTKINDSL